MTKLSCTPKLLWVGRPEKAWVFLHWVTLCVDTHPFSRYPSPPSWAFLTSDWIHLQSPIVMTQCLTCCHEDMPIVIKVTRWRTGWCDGDHDQQMTGSWSADSLEDSAGDRQKDRPAVFCYWINWGYECFYGINRDGCKFRSRRTALLQFLESW